MKTEITVIENVSAETPASVTVLGAQTLRQIPGVNIDDRLRLVPGFTLLRRSSSLAANPTTQGISLRGIGSSGASRTLVLWDGLPLNDPFGGWVYWTRINAEETERVEVSRGATISVFGDRAMGGSIHLLTRQPDRQHIALGVDAGNRRQWMPMASYSNLLRGRIGVTASARAFQTDGYFIVPQSIRGRADVPAGVRFVAPMVKLDFIGARHRFFLKSDMLIEDRDNGTPIQTNSTSIGSVSASYSRDGISALVFHQRQEFRAGFSAIAADRNSERLTFRQSVPAEATGGAVFGTLRRTSVNVTGGIDFLRAEGVSRDWMYPGAPRIGGGVQFQRGLFGQADFTWRSLKLFAGSRYQWTGRGADTFYSPSGGFSYGRGWLRARGSIYRAFRAPTLNELFREFRAGNTVTLANSALRPEVLFGSEVGIDAVGERVRFSVTAYRNQIDDIIGNATLRVQPNLITRQRQNLAQALARGIEADFRYRWSRWTLETAYLMADSRFATRERIPQVPRHQGSAQLIWQRESTLVAGGFRSSALQFEDDRNTQLLPGFLVWHLTARQSLGKGLVAHFALENAFDRTYLSGFTPQPQIAAPRLWRLGLRWSR